MKKMRKFVCLVMSIIMMLLAVPCFAVGNDAGESAATEKITESTTEANDNTKAAKAIAAAVAIAIAAGLSAVAMGHAIAKSAEGISRQPEAGDNIKSGLMLGLVFIETVVIYALIVAILIIFVL